MLSWLRRRFGLETPHVYPDRYMMSLDHIESQIRGLKMLEELRSKHRNWKGAEICRAEIKVFEEYKQFLNSYGSKTLCVITKDNP